LSYFLVWNLKMLAMGGISSSLFYRRIACSVLVVSSLGCFSHLWQTYQRRPDVHSEVKLLKERVTPYIIIEGEGSTALYPLSKTILQTELFDLCQELSQAIESLPNYQEYPPLQKLYGKVQERNQLLGKTGVIWLTPLKPLEDLKTALVACAQLCIKGTRPTKEEAAWMDKCPKSVAELKEQKEPLKEQIEKCIQELLVWIEQFPGEKAKQENWFSELDLRDADVDQLVLLKSQEIFCMEGKLSCAQAAKFGAKWLCRIYRIVVNAEPIALQGSLVLHPIYEKICGALEPEYVVFNPLTFWSALICGVGALALFK
jgi:hypothetical protein